MRESLCTSLSIAVGGNRGADDAVAPAEKSQLRQIFYYIYIFLYKSSALGLNSLVLADQYISVCSTSAGKNISPPTWLWLPHSKC